MEEKEEEKQGFGENYSFLKKNKVDKERNKPL